MEEETNNELLINTEPQATEQPTNQQTQQPTPEQNQEAAETPKQQEEQKMSEVDLSKMSLEELQAEIERRKQEESRPKFELDENDPSNLARFLQTIEFLPVYAFMNSGAIVREALSYPGKLNKFVFLYDDNGKRTNDKNKASSARLISVYEDFVVNELVLGATFRAVLEKM